MTSGYLRASDRDRDQVTEVLHAAYAEGKLDLDEHTERTTAALNARTFDELAALTSDLVPAPPTALLTPVRTPAVYDGDEPDRVTAMLAESNRTGPWQVKRVTQANVFLGSVTLDLTEATFPAQRDRGQLHPGARPDHHPGSAGHHRPGRGGERARRLFGQAHR